MNSPENAVAVSAIAGRTAENIGETAALLIETLPVAAVVAGGLAVAIGSLRGRQRPEVEKE